MQKPQVLLRGPLALSDRGVQEVKPPLTALFPVALGGGGFERQVEELRYTGPFFGTRLRNHFPEDLVLFLGPLKFGLRMGLLSGNVKWLGLERDPFLVAVLRLLSGEKPCYIYPILRFEVLYIHKLL